MILQGKAPFSSITIEMFSRLILINNNFLLPLPHGVLYSFQLSFFFALSSSLSNLYRLVLAGEDQHRRGRSRADGTWLPESSGPGRGGCHPCGKTKHIPHRLHRQLPCRLKNCPSGEEPLDLETFSCSPTLLSQGHIYTSSALTGLSRNTFTLSLIHFFSSPTILNHIHEQLNVNCLLFQLILCVLLPVLRLFATVPSACAIV